MELFLEAKAAKLTEEEIRNAVEKSLEGRWLHRVLILPPDYTRYHSGAGRLTVLYDEILRSKGCSVDIMPALGTHEKMSREQFETMYPGIAYERMLVHDWRKDTVELGRIPEEAVSQMTNGVWKESLAVQVNRRLLEPSYDLILSIGQVVPHEVVGMANYTKNIFVGAGGNEMIHKSHMIGAVCGLESIMGKDHTPVRKLYDYALSEFLHRPILFVLTVTDTKTVQDQKTGICGLFISESRHGFERAVRLSRQKNICFTKRAIRKCVVYLDPEEFRSTWLGNKAIYRTRMAIAEGGELLILAPGIERFGEDPVCDALIRKYGYCGREKILAEYEKESNLRKNMGVAAHLIHGSSEGKFRITYAVTQKRKEEIKSVGYEAEDYEKMSQKYNPEKLLEGWNVMEDGEEIYYISNPARGLWIDKNREKKGAAL